MNVYIHIPFCVSKCAYCAFLSLTDLKLEDQYIENLVAEIKERGNSISDEIETIYFGGGTPSLLKVENLTKIFNALEDFSRSKECEITLEANPENITKDKLLAWKKLGVNRISIGVQSMNDKVRKTVGRSLTGSEVLERVKLARDIFENVGIDLIAGLPGDDWHSTKSAIEGFEKVGIEHISLYDLELAQGSCIANNPEKFNFLSEEKRQEILVNAWNLLEKHGFEQYEISNFAKNGHYTKHNLDFWYGKNYLGFGLGAVSRLDNTVYSNTSELPKYFKGEYVDRIEKLKDEELQTLDLANRIRLNNSLSNLKLNEKKFLRIVESGLIDREGFVTKKGKLYNDYLLKELL